MLRSTNAQLPINLLSRLRHRRPEIEAAILTRVSAVAEPRQVSDPLYVDGFRGAVAAAVDYSFAAIELGDERTPPPPSELRAQARLAARNGVSLDTVLRRCFAGQAVIADFIVEEVERSGPHAATQLQSLLRAQAAVFDLLIAAITEEHARESDNDRSSARERRVKRIKRLLAGELLDTHGLEYDFHRQHLGLVATGPAADQAIQALAKALDRRLLLVYHGEETVWVWLGGRQRLDPADVQRHLSSVWPPQVRVAVGEPAEKLAGWRLTHEQAKAALSVALRGNEPIVRYAEVALLASVLRDDLWAESLREIYLRPLEADGGTVLRETLRAYFAAERNVSSAAAQLGVRRETVTNRLRVVERLVGRPVGACAAELESALRLHECAAGQIPRSGG